MNLTSRMQRYSEALDACHKVTLYGRVRQVTGLVIESDGPAGSIGDFCTIRDGRGKDVPAEIVGFRNDAILLMPLGEIESLRPGCAVVSKAMPLWIRTGPELLGRVIGGLGDPIDGNGPLRCTRRRKVNGGAPPALSRKPIREAMPTGVRVIDGLLTCGQGQRVGIFAAAGVGKSMLLGQIARQCSADVNVIALIGERGREVREFIENNLGEEGLQKSVVVVVTSDQHSLLRLKGMMVATSIAEYFRDEGKNVMLLVDSITRVARAQRETGLSLGEPPATRGYTPSTFALLPRLLERTGVSDKGSITAMYAVLVEGDDLDEPVSDTVRSILDGHVVLSRKLADRGVYPAVDVLQSVSRVMPSVISREHLKLALEFKEHLSAYEDARDLINLGAYSSGSNPKIDRAVAIIDKMFDFIKQDCNETAGYDEVKRMLNDIINSSSPKVNQQKDANKSPAPA